MIKKKDILIILIYLTGIAINMIIIDKYYKVNFAYDDSGKSFLKALSVVSFAALPAVIFVCYDSNRKWCNQN